MRVFVYKGSSRVNNQLFQSLPTYYLSKTVSLGLRESIIRLHYVSIYLKIYNVLLFCY